MFKIHLVGTSNIGKYRELKRFTEKYWKCEKFDNYLNLILISKKIRFEKIFLQTINNFDLISIGDFSLYDNVLDISCLINSFNNNNIINEKKYFSFARGNKNITPGKMTKFFNTNYHYIIPENFKNLKILNKKIFNEINEIKKIGILPKIILLGPISYLWLSLGKKKEFLNLFNIYLYIVKNLLLSGIKIIQFDEPILCCKINNNWKNLFEFFYKEINNLNIKIIISTFFCIENNNLFIFKKYENFILHISSKKNIENFKNKLSLGLIENNLLKTNLLYKYNNCKEKNIFFSIERDTKNIPIDLSIEELKIQKYFSFFFQKINEIKLLKRMFFNKINCYDILYLNNFFIYKEKIKIKNIFSKIKKKNTTLNKKLISYTSIGSFPQNKEVRISRKNFNKKIINLLEYKNILKENIYLCILRQVFLKFDILTHGEFERTDMVEYFANNINGVFITKNGWIQSYGTRYVKPPIILNIYNCKSLTENWFSFSKSITKKKIKIILSGPITILKWSFFLDIYKFFICLKISNIISNEINFLQKKFNLFQIDEPTIKECLPLNKNNWKLEINNFLFCFNNCTKYIKKNNEIHTHICYSIFEDVINLIYKLNIDVLTIESTREKMENLKIFSKNLINIGPGMYDVHTPIIFTKNKIKNNFFKSLKFININKFWINPDCGLKTRNWYELNYSLKNLFLIKKKIFEIFN